MPDTSGIDVEFDRSMYWLDLRRSLQRFVAPRVERDAVDDIVSSVMLKLVSNRDDFARANDPMAWIYRIASNSVTDYYRSRAAARRLQTKVTAEHGLEASEIKQPDNRATSELSQCLTPLISRLAPHYREALTLVAIDGLSQVEAAKQLGIPLSTLKSRVQRARKKLREEVLGCCAVEVDRRGNVIDYERKAEGATPCHCPPSIRNS